MARVEQLAGIKDLDPTVGGAGYRQMPDFRRGEYLAGIPGAEQWKHRPIILKFHGQEPRAKNVENFLTGLGIASSFTNEDGKTPTLKVEGKENVIKFYDQVVCAAMAGEFVDRDRLKELSKKEDKTAVEKQELRTLESDLTKTQVVGIRLHEQLFGPLLLHGAFRAFVMGDPSAFNEEHQARLKEWREQQERLMKNHPEMSLEQLKLMERHVSQAIAEQLYKQWAQLAAGIQAISAGRSSSL